MGCVLIASLLVAGCGTHAPTCLLHVWVPADAGLIGSGLHARCGACTWDGWQWAAAGGQLWTCLLACSHANLSEHRLPGATRSVLGLPGALWRDASALVARLVATAPLRVQEASTIRTGDAVLLQLR